PTATRAAVSRAEARSSTGRASPKPYFCMPVRSAWPGRGRVRGTPRPVAVASGSSTGSGLITSIHFGHSVVSPRTGRGRARGAAVAQPPEHLEAVLLEAHALAAAVAEPPPGQLAGDLVAGQGHARRQPLEHGDQRRPVGLPGGQIAQPRADARGSGRPGR